MATFTFWSPGAPSLTLATASTASALQLNAGSTGCQALFQNTGSDVCWVAMVSDNGQAVPTVDTATWFMIPSGVIAGPIALPSGAIMICAAANSGTGTLRVTMGRDS